MRQSTAVSFFLMIIVAYGGWMVLNKRDASAVSTAPVIVQQSYSAQSNKPLKISWYDPALGGTNCDHDCTTMASGTKVTPDRYGNTAACVAEWTRQRKVVVIPGVGKFQCLDTGGAIKEHSDYIWIDLLLKSPIVPFGSLIYDWYLE